MLTSPACSRLAVALLASMPSHTESAPVGNAEAEGFPGPLCQDAQFVETHLARLALFAPPVEADNFKKTCGQ